MCLGCAAFMEEISHECHLQTRYRVRDNKRLHRSQRDNRPGEGLAPIRRGWILGRGDIEEYQGHTVKPEDNRNISDDKLVEEFPNLRPPLRSKGGKSVNQYCYAHQGVITQEREYIAPRENMVHEHDPATTRCRKHALSSVGMTISIWALTRNGPAISMTRPYRKRPAKQPISAPCADRSALP